MPHNKEQQEFIFGERGGHKQLTNHSLENLVYLKCSILSCSGRERILWNTKKNLSIKVILKNERYFSAAYLVFVVGLFCSILYAFVSEVLLTVHLFLQNFQNVTDITQDLWAELGH